MIEEIKSPCTCWGFECLGLLNGSLVGRPVPPPSFLHSPPPSPSISSFLSSTHTSKYASSPLVYPISLPSFLHSPPPSPSISSFLSSTHTSKYASSPLVYPISLPSFLHSPPPSPSISSFLSSTHRHPAPSISRNELVRIIRVANSAPSPTSHCS